MILYHGTNIGIDEIDLNMCRPFRDFGRGFYLTTIEEQAVKMANRISKIRNGVPCVNIFEVPDDFMERSELCILDFGDAPSAEWALFVMNNRNPKYGDRTNPNCNHDNKYDIVHGPVANDDMAMLFRQYENRLIDFEMLTRGLTYKKMSDQYSFHTKKAAALLKKVGML